MDVMLENLEHRLSRSNAKIPFPLGEIASEFITVEKATVFQNRKNCTLFHMACKEGQFDVVELN